MAKRWAAALLILAVLCLTGCQDRSTMDSVRVNETTAEKVATAAETSTPEPAVTATPEPVSADKPEPVPETEAAKAAAAAETSTPEFAATATPAPTPVNTPEYVPETAEAKYQRAQSLLAENRFAEAAALFDELGGYEDSVRMAMYCKAVAAGEGGDYEIALTSFELLGDYRESALMRVYYAARRDEDIAAADSSKWNGWTDAAKGYDSLALFRDSRERAQACREAAYSYAVLCAGDAEYDTAVQVLRELNGYEDSRQLSIYYEAARLIDMKKYEDARKLLVSLGDYRDAEEILSGLPELDAPVTATLSFKFDATTVPTVGALLESFYSGASDLLAAAVNICDNITIEGTWGKSAGQLNVLLKEQPLAYAAVSSDEYGITAVSDLLPNDTVIRMSTNDLLRYLGIYYGKKPVSLDINPADLALIENAVVWAVQKTDSGIASRTDEAEAGSWTFEGTTFTSRRRINASLREIGVIALKAVRDVIRNPEMIDLMGRISIYPTDLDPTPGIEYLEKTARDDYYPVLEAYRYSNENGDTFTEGFLSQYDVTYTAQYGIIGGNIYARFSMPRYGEFVLKADSQGNSYDFSAEINNVYVYVGRSMYISGKVHAAGSTARNGEREGAIDIQVLGMDILTMNYTIRRDKEITASFDTAGKEIISDVSSYPFYQLMRTRLAEIAGKVSGIMPEDFQKLLPLVRRYYD